MKCTNEGLYSYVKFLLFPPLKFEQLKILLVDENVIIILAIKITICKSNDKVN